MRWRQTLLSVCASCVALSSSAAAASFEGEWIGGFGARDEWHYLQVRIGGEGADMAGRADLPDRGQDAVLMQRVHARGDRLMFEIPGPDGSLRFDGTARGPGRLTGTLRVGRTETRFELLRLRPLSPRQVTDLSGEYIATAAARPVLIFSGQTGLLFVDYTTGRIGRLFPLSDGRFVAGPSVAAGYPIELTMTPAAPGAITWTRNGDPPVVLRRQPSYRIQDATVESTDGVTLSGRLLLPASPGRHPAVVLVPGTGRITADGLMPFADSLARSGVAVLIHDKRGVGESTGVYSRAGIHELADDALAGVAWLSRHPGIDATQIGLVGTSLGGWVAPLAASRSRDVRFIILEAPPAVSPAVHERMRVENQMRADGLGPDLISRALTFMDRKFDVGRSGDGWEALQTLAERGQREGWLGYTNAPTSLESMRWNWEHVLSYDPAPVLRRLRVPVLALYAGLDRIVDPAVNRPLLEQALRTAGNADVTVRVFPKANHHFMTAVTGGPGEVARLGSFVDGYFASRVAWLADRTEAGTVVLTDSGAGAVDEDRLALLTKAPHLR